MKTKDLILSLLTRTYEKDAWHGPSVKEVLDHVNPRDVHKRVNGSHSIIELVAHIVSWRKFVIRKLQGDNGFEVSDEENFPTVPSWEMIVTELNTTQRELINAIQQFPENRLNEKVPNREYDFSTLLHGIIHHDIYHIGQIQLLLR